MLRIGDKLIKKIRGDGYHITCIQLIGYGRRTYKCPHFDGQYMTNNEEVWGYTLDNGKNMSVGSTMHYGYPSNKWTLLKNAKGTLYRMRGKFLWWYWHSIQRIAVKRNRTIMFRCASISKRKSK